MQQPKHCKTNLLIKQGATFARGWLVKFNGTPIDSTWTARGQARARISSDTVLVDLAPSVNDDGSVVFAISAEESSAWSWRKAVYDIEVVNADASVEMRVAEGNITVSPEVTR